MTVFAYRDGVLCSDSLISSHGTVLGYAQKIFKNKQGYIGGTTGAASNTLKFQNWFNRFLFSLYSIDECDLDEDAGGLIISPAKEIYCIQKAGLYKVDFAYAADGSAYQIAIGAMEAGATAKEACLYAIKLQPGNCGGEIQELRLD